MLINIIRLLVMHVCLVFSFALFALVPIQGDEFCQYGEFGCSPCVNDVNGRFEEISGRRSERETFRFPADNRSLNNYPAPSLRVKSHAQGVSRLSGVGDENWMVLSHSGKELGDTGIYLFTFDWLRSLGEAWVFGDILDNFARRYFYYPFENFNHAGGVDTLGGLLIVALDCNRSESCDAEIQFLDVSRPWAPRYLSSIKMNFDEFEGRPIDYNLHAGAAGGARLADGRMLVYVRGSNQGAFGQFFISKNQDIRHGWSLVSAWKKEKLPEGTPWYSWENTSFVTECGTKNLYMIGSGTMRSRFNLYQVVWDEKKGHRSLNFKFKAAKRLRTGRLLTGARNGGGVHITPHGELVFYVTDRRPPYRIQEFY